MKAVIKVGNGRSQSGKILDEHTHWYNIDTRNNIDECDNAIEYATFTGRPTFISINQKAYKPITIEQIKNLLT